MSVPATLMGLNAQQPGAPAPTGTQTPQTPVQQYQGILDPFGGYGPQGGFADPFNVLGGLFGGGATPMNAYQQARYQALTPEERLVAGGNVQTAQQLLAERLQREQNYAFLQEQNLANRPTQITPEGRVEWTRDPDTGAWTQTTTLSPEAQAAREAQARITAGRSGLAESLLGRVGGEFGEAPDWSQLTAQPGTPQADAATRERTEQALYEREARRFEPELQEQREALQTQLANQGIGPESEAYRREMQRFEQSAGDVRERARQQAIIGGGAEEQRQFGMQLQGAGFQAAQRQQQIAEMLQRRGWSLNEINAILSGQQIGMPNMPSFAQTGRAESNAYGSFQDAQAQEAARRNAEQMQQQGMLSGLGTIAGAFLSDIRVKENIVRVGDDARGFGWYLFNYIGESARLLGVIAQEVARVKPEAVAQHESGYLMVNYSAL